MGGVPRPILMIVWAGLLLAAGTGFVLGFTQSDRKATTADAAPIAANLPANVVIKDAEPLAPPPPPPPKVRAAAQDDSDEADEESDAAPAPAARTARAAAPDDGPAPVPIAPSLPGQPLPADLPPT